MQQQESILLNNYEEVKQCIYKGERYSVRDNGAVMRHLREGKKARRDDGVWTFGVKNAKTGYMHFGNTGGHRVHIIVATAFMGARDSNAFVVDHIDTNRCNNRVDNLRWCTKLENALNNEITRHKIMYLCGSIEAFVENPAILKERIDRDPSLEWMSAVTKEEAATALENNKRYWAEQAQNPKPLKGGKLDSRVYQRQDSNFTSDRNKILNMDSNLKDLNMMYRDERQLVQAKNSRIALQKNWKTPTDFLCCPVEMGDNPIEEYFNRLVIGASYNSTVYNGSDDPVIQKIVDKAYINDKNAILVISWQEGGIKPYALSKISIADQRFIHESLGTFLEEKGVRKQFTLGQGLAWTGGDGIDDYC